MPDPFADSEMRERVAKLLRLLASDAAGEAEAARIALLRHLARHGASLDDLARHLLDSRSTLAAMPGRSVTAALAAAERRAALAEAAASTAAAEAERLRVTARRLQTASIAGAGFAALLLALAWLQERRAPVSVPVSAAAMVPALPVAPVPASPPQPTRTAPEPAPMSAREPQRPALRTGRVVAGAGVPLRLDPVPDALPVATLRTGTQVTIDQAFPMRGVNWLQVRTPKGAGFVPAAAIDAQ